jgi:hypothetical protein
VYEIDGSMISSRDGYVPAEAIIGGRMMLLTTRERDGATVGPPVNVAVGRDERAYFRTLRRPPRF